MATYTLENNFSGRDYSEESLLLFSTWFYDTVADGHIMSKANNDNYLELLL